MKFFGITQKTADWLIRTPKCLSAFAKELANINSIDSLHEGIIVIGTLHICSYQNKLIIAWNSDYLSSTGVEDWGFFLLDGEDGIFSHPEIIEEVFERTIFLINQRLQGLILPSDTPYIHRNYGDNRNSCIAGRGAIARRFSLGYKEGTFKVDIYSIKSLLSIGPWGGEIDGLVRRIDYYSNNISGLLRIANSTLNTSSKRPVLDSSIFSGIREHFTLPLKQNPDEIDGIVEVIPELSSEDVIEDKSYETLLWTYSEWIDPKSPLSEAQRTILENDIITRQPLRIIGSAGTGKTLLMQLLCFRRLEAARQQGESVRILYVVHNNEMANNILNRFLTLKADDFLDNQSNQVLEIKTLFSYAQDKLSLPSTEVIDKDAYQTKLFQREVIIESIDEVSKKFSDKIAKSKFLKELLDNVDSINVYADLIANEIGVTIKGRDLTNNKQRYLESEKPLSRLHSILSQDEREIIFEIFSTYHRKVFEEYQVLDSDDVALSLIGQLKTPLWEMRRRKEGFDFVFIDETQLFNENERQIFHLLTKGDKNHLPIALALDETQALHGAISAGFATLGIENISNQTLFSVYRSTQDILKLAFFIIQRTTDLFTIDFPDFTHKTTTLVPSTHPLAAKPILVVHSEEPYFAKSVLREIRDLRNKNIRQIAVVIHSDKYWTEIIEFFKEDNRRLPIIIQTKRGERIDPQQPTVVITRPESVGGQEFDAVIAVGIEKGVVPVIVKNHSGLETALEQQFLRELYLSFTRARYRLILLNAKGSMPSTIIEHAIRNNLVDVR